jgi:outer membrane protein OmpA-like peptidoglycan-associated protein
MKTNKILLTSACGGLFLSCAATTPNELVSARAAYQRASQGSASQVAPAEVHVAHQALIKAEKAFEQDPESYRTLDLAYVAQRRSEMAMAVASISIAQKNQEQATEEYRETTEDISAKTRQDLSDSQKELAAANRSDQLATAQLDAAEQARLAAEAKLSVAMKDLAAFADVKEESRGVVITLSGEVLFVSGKYELMETAKTKLDQVAEALKSQDAEKDIVIEGHADSTGSDQVNQPLSLNRASAVRNYLISRGVRSSKMTAVGLGSHRPLASNATASGRANNRRVEIVIESDTQAALSGDKLP